MPIPIQTATQLVDAWTGTSPAAESETNGTSGVSLRRVVHAIVFYGESRYVADCLEVPVVTQGRTLDETIANLREAVALHMEDADLDELGIIRDPTISVTLELEPADGAP